MSKKEKKKLQHEIAATLSSTLTSLTKNLSEKKFQRNIRKASRILVDGIKAKTDKKSSVKKADKPVKELAVSK